MEKNALEVGLGTRILYHTYQLYWLSHPREQKKLCSKFQLDLTNFFSGALFLCMPLLNACLDRVLVSWMMGAGILRDGFWEWWGCGMLSI